MARTNNSHARAFTLLELIVVMVLIGIAAVVGGNRFLAYKDRADLEHILQRVAHADRRERQLSRSSPYPGRLEFDSAKGRFRFQHARHELNIPKGAKVIAFWVAPDAPESRAVYFANTGQSHTYALGIRTPGGAEQWLVVFGISGQIRTTRDGAEARSWIQLATGA
jgi:prepilin-type N-terminal cleavage/methylation domain-containing protein